MGASGRSRTRLRHRCRMLIVRPLIISTALTTALALPGNHARSEEHAAPHEVKREAVACASVALLDRFAFEVTFPAEVPCRLLPAGTKASWTGNSELDRVRRYLSAAKVKVEGAEPVYVLSASLVPVAPIFSEREKGDRAAGGLPREGRSEPGETSGLPILTQDPGTDDVVWQDPRRRVTRFTAPNGAPKSAGTAEPSQDPLSIELTWQNPPRRGTASAAPSGEINSGMLLNPARDAEPARKATDSAASSAGSESLGTAETQTPDAPSQLAGAAQTRPVPTSGTEVAELPVPFREAMSDRAGVISQGLPQSPPPPSSGPETAELAVAFGEGKSVSTGAIPLSLPETLPPKSEQIVPSRESGYGNTGEMSDRPPQTSPAPTLSSEVAELPLPFQEAMSDNTGTRQRPPQPSPVQSGNTGVISQSPPDTPPAPSSGSQNAELPVVSRGAMSDNSGAASREASEIRPAQPSQETASAMTGVISQSLSGPNSSETVEAIATQGTRSNAAPAARQAPAQSRRRSLISVSSATDRAGVAPLPPRRLAALPERNTPSTAAQMSNPPGGARIKSSGTRVSGRSEGGVVSGKGDRSSQPAADDRLRSRDSTSQREPIGIRPARGPSGERGRFLQSRVSARGHAARGRGPDADVAQRTPQRTPRIASLRGGAERRGSRSESFPAAATYSLVPELPLALRPTRPPAGTPL